MQLRRGFGLLQIHQQIDQRDLHDGRGLLAKRLR